MCCDQWLTTGGASRAGSTVINSPRSGRCGCGGCTWCYVWRTASCLHCKEGWCRCHWTRPHQICRGYATCPNIRNLLLVWFLFFKTLFMKSIGTIRKPNFGVVVVSNNMNFFHVEHLAPHKRLRGGVKFVAEIPKSPSGKILRRFLLKLDEPTKSKLWVWI